MQLEDRVKFYSDYDLSLGTNLSKSEELLRNLDTSKPFEDVNVALAWYNTWLCFDSSRRLMDWTDNEYENLLAITKKIPPLVNRFFCSIEDNTFVLIFNSVDFMYRREFWKLVAQCKVYEKITDATLEQSLDSDAVALRCVLTHKKIIERFGDVIAGKLRSDPKHAELLLKPHVRTTGAPKTAYHFPKELLHSEREAIIGEYIQTENPNLNLLDIITNLRNSDLLRISDKTRLSAKKRHHSYTQSYFENNTGFSFGVEICFDCEQEDVMRFNFNKTKYVLELSYATSWFDENRDYPTLLNNFIHIFQYTDMWCRSYFPIRPSESKGFFTSMFFRGIDDYYNKDSGYQLNHMMHTGQMSMYYGWLSKEELHLELVFKWFFEEYLPMEFGIEGFFLSSCHDKSTYVEKCKSLVIEIERVLKQFKIYVEEGCVDSELMDISSGAVRFEDVPSLCTNKYIYPAGDECENIRHHLFSDQAHLSLSGHERYDSFAQAVHNDTLNYNEFYDFQKVNLDYLVEKQVIEVDSCGNITAGIDIVGLLDDLHRNQVCCFSYMHKYVDLVESFKTKDWIEFDSTLFTRPEQEYLDYVMNNSKFTNSLGLRNKYCHGAYPISETQNYTDYLEILKVMVLVIVKINEEFCLRADMFDKDHKKVRAN